MPHTCHAIGCTTIVRPELLMCLAHWLKMPINLRTAVLKHYRNGQCVDKDPSREWLAAAKAAIKFVAKLEGRSGTEP